MSNENGALNTGSEPPAQATQAAVATNTDTSLHGAIFAESDIGDTTTTDTKKPDASQTTKPATADDKGTALNSGEPAEGDNDGTDGEQSDGQAQQGKNQPAIPYEKFRTVNERLRAAEQELADAKRWSPAVQRFQQQYGFETPDATIEFMDKQQEAFERDQLDKQLQATYKQNLIDFGEEAADRFKQVDIALLEAKQREARSSEVLQRVEQENAKRDHFAQADKLFGEVSKLYPADTHAEIKSMLVDSAGDYMPKTAAALTKFAQSLTNKTRADYATRKDSDRQATTPAPEASGGKARTDSNAPGKLDFLKQPLSKLISGG